VPFLNSDHSPVYATFNIPALPPSVTAVPDTAGCLVRITGLSGRDLLAKDPNGLSDPSVQLRGTEEPHGGVTGQEGVKGIKRRAGRRRPGNAKWERWWCCEAMSERLPRPMARSSHLPHFSSSLSPPLCAAYSYVVVRGPIFTDSRTPRINKVRPDRTEHVALGWLCASLTLASEPFAPLVSL